jgi:hypothetical protein
MTWLASRINEHFYSTTAVVQGKTSVLAKLEAAEDTFRRVEAFWEVLMKP